MRVMKNGMFHALGIMGALSGCATITNDPNQSVEFVGLNCAEREITCTAKNKRGLWDVELPGTAMIRRSDDVLHVSCSDDQGKTYQTQTESRMGGKIVASAIFLDFGIVDSITDKHREYPAQIMVDCSR